jgi:hypothetical protein
MAVMVPLVFGMKFMLIRAGRTEAMAAEAEVLFLSLTQTPIHWLTSVLSQS